MTTTPEQLRAELLEQLKTHDWFFDRADDSRWYVAGRKQHERILELVRLVPDGLQLYEAHRPKSV